MVGLRDFESFYGIMRFSNGWVLGNVRFFINKVFYVGYLIGFFFLEVYDIFLVNVFKLFVDNFFFSMFRIFYFLMGIFII